MSIRVGIMGYGNLGRGIECALKQNDDMELVAVFSRRDPSTVKILTEGGPGESTNLMVYSIYRDAFFNYRFGSAAAQSVILFLIIMGLTLVMFRIEKKGVHY